LQPLEQLNGKNLLSDPGSTYNYSSYGYNLLGAVMASAAGQEFECLLNKLVLDPLKLSETTIDDPERIVDRRAKQYVRISPGDASISRRNADEYGVTLAKCPDSQLQPLQLANAPFVDNTCKIPSGGLLSTATDLVKFASYFVNKTTFLKPETIQMLFTPHYTSSGIPTKYGLGWAIEGSLGDDLPPAIVKHTGGASGGSSVLIVFPEHRLAVSLIVNLEGINLSEAATRIAKHFIADIKGDSKKLVIETQTIRFDDEDLAEKPLKKHKKEEKGKKKEENKKKNKDKKKDGKKKKKSKKEKKKKQGKKKGDKKKDDKKKKNKKEDKEDEDQSVSEETTTQIALTEKQIELLKKLEEKLQKKEEKLKKKELKKLKKGKKGKKDKKKDKKKKKSKKDKKKDKKKKKKD